MRVYTPWNMILPASILFCLLVWIVSGNPLFWDTIQFGSRHAHWFYDNDFKYLTLDPAIDSGHPPVFGMYIALTWKIFGRSLAVTHFAMLPFLIGIIFQAAKLSKKLFANQTHAWFAFIFILLEPTLLSQSILISPDVVLVFFFLLGENAILNGNKILKIIAVVGLGMISMRGMMSAVALFVAEILIFKKEDGGLKIKNIFERILPYIPGGICAALWLAWHYSATGWIGYHKGSSWNESFEPVGFGGMIKNAALVGWRFLDFGRIIWWVIGGGLLFSFFVNRKQIPESAKITGTLFFITTLFYLPNTLPYSGVSGHRYFLIPFIFFSLFIFSLLVHWIKPARIIIFYVLISLSLLSGHLWRYPEGIAMGWDSTLGHYGWYKAKTEMQKYLVDEKIPFEDIGSAFPALASQRLTDIADDRHEFHSKDLEKDSLILYSNIMNGFTDPEISELKTRWKVKKEFSSLGIKVILYEKPQSH